MVDYAGSELEQRVKQRIRRRAWDILLDIYKFIPGGIFITWIVMYTSIEEGSSIWEDPWLWGIYAAMVLVLVLYALWKTLLRLFGGPRRVISWVSSKALARVRQKVAESGLVQLLLEGQITGKELSRFSRRSHRPSSSAERPSISNSTIDDVAYNCCCYFHRYWLTRSEFIILLRILPLFLFLLTVIMVICIVTVETPELFNTWWHIPFITMYGVFVLISLIYPFYELKAAPFELAFFDELLETVARQKSES